jgi:hypothetical protein
MIILKNNLWQKARASKSKQQQKKAEKEEEEGKDNCN